MPLPPNGAQRTNSSNACSTQRLSGPGGGLPDAISENPSAMLRLWHRWPHPGANYGFF
ncbi:MAG: hypothetical protein F6K65_42960 [Moorea sp. SIO3C2]|nr:hypothetical protein [Moorena sp. SIO3C2]